MSTPGGQTRVDGDDGIGLESAWNGNHLECRRANTSIEELDNVFGARSRVVLSGRRRVALVVAVVVVGAACGTVGSAGAPVSGITSITDFTTPGGDPWGTAFDGTGGVWVTMPGCDPAPSCASSTPPGKLARFDPDTHRWTTTVSLPSGYGQPLFVAVDATGKVWFTMPVTNSIGVYDPASTTVSQWPVPTVSSGPWGIAVGRDGLVWFSEHFVNKIGSFDPSSRKFREVSTPAADSDPYGITVDAANDVWFTENTDSVARVGEYTASGVLDEYGIRNTSTAGTGLTPHLITIDRSGNPWWSEGWVSSIATLDLAAARPGTNRGVTEFRYAPSCGTCGSHTSGIASDRQGRIWLDDSLQNTFGSFPVGGGSFSFYASPRSHPHDGLGVDSRGRVWFDEEFGNGLAEAIPATSTTTTTSTSTSTTSTTTSTSSSTTTTTTTVPVSASLGRDTFVRANQALWGKASDGQTWGGDANAANVFSVAANTGRVTDTGGTSYSAVLGPGAANADVRLTGSLSAYTNSNFGAVARYVDANNWYKAYLDGTNLVIQKKVAGATTILTTTPFAATPGATYTIDFQVTGITLDARAWLTSGPPPATWTATAAATSLTSGFTGIRVLTQTGTATITSFQATSLP